MNGRPLRRPAGQAGFTLLEMAIALALASIVISMAGMAFSALLDGFVDSDRRFRAQEENARALLALVEDLKTAKTTDSDELGVPYFQVVDLNGGKANGIVFRRVQGFDADPLSAEVRVRYGEPIRYAVDAEGLLIRTQGGTQRVVATGVSQLAFSLSASGTVEARIVTTAGQGSPPLAIENTVSVTPVNA